MASRGGAARTQPFGVQLRTISVFAVKQMKPLDFTLEEMRDLLETLDASGDGADDADEVHDRLAMYAAAADARCEKLRDQLAAAEEIAARVRREASR